VRIWKLDGTLLGTVDLIVPDDWIPEEPGPLFAIINTTTLSGLSLSKADVNGLRAGPKMPTPGWVHFYAWDFEIDYVPARPILCVTRPGILEAETRDNSVDSKARGAIDVETRPTNPAISLGTRPGPLSIGRGGKAGPQ